MNVTLVVDALTVQLGGIGRYTLELCRRIPVQPGMRSVGYYSNGSFVENPDSLLNGATPQRARGRAERYMSNWLSRRRLARTLVHGPNYFLPPQVEGGIVTIHDLSVFRYPQSHPVERVRAFEREFESSLGRALHVITDTETVRRELISEFGVGEQKVSAIALGVDQRYRPHTEDELRPRLLELGLQPGGYGLCVSTIEPRKKIPELLQAWRDLPRKLRDSTPLVLAGCDGWLSEAIHEQIRDGVGAGWLKHLGFVPESLLPSLYSGASLFLYPSIYEGFGLPPVEAMASGVPVLVSNRSCLPEVCGTAAGYLDPDDIEQVREKIIQALTDTAWRRSAKKEGLRIAKRLSWDSCAAATAGIYRRYAH